MSTQSDTLLLHLGQTAMVPQFAFGVKTPPLDKIASVHFVPEPGRDG